MAAIGLAIHKNVKVAILRPFHVFGDGEREPRLWPSLRKAALAGEDFPMTRGEQVRDFVPVETVARWFLDSATSVLLRAGHPEIYNVGTGVAKTVFEFCDEWWGQFGAKGRLKVGELPYRRREVMRFVPLVLSPCLDLKRQRS
jgi:nucleoside-diphosphate-sugar epimerase